MKEMEICYIYIKYPKKYTDEDHKLSITQLQEKITIKKTEKDIEEYTNTSVEVFSGTEEEIEVNIY